MPAKRPTPPKCSLVSSKAPVRAEAMPQMATLLADRRLPEMPAYLQPGAPLPQTNLDKKYAPLGVPVMAGPQYGKPFVFTTTFTREQTVALHENQVGEKMQRVGDALPVVGEPLSTMGSAIAQRLLLASMMTLVCALGSNSHPGIGEPTQLM